MEGCHQFLDLVPKEKEFHDIVKNESGKTSLNVEDTNDQLELRLGPPGGKYCTTNIIKQKNKNNSQTKNHFGHFSSKNNQSQWLHLHSTYSAVMDEPSQQNYSDKEAYTSAVQKRTAPAPVVGWPPVRSFRKNLASGSSSKPNSKSIAVVLEKGSSQKCGENCVNGLFVKINMDGIPIGRKVDLKVYDSYDKLSRAVDELFKGLLAAQSDAGGIKGNEGGAEVVGSIMDGNGEYTLVYEDHEGDRMLVGDVPWHMFVSTVKRIRVLKSSKLPALLRGRSKHRKLSLDA